MLQFYGHTEATYEEVLNKRRDDMVFNLHEQGTGVEGIKELFSDFGEGDVHVAKKQEIYAIKHLIRKGIPVLVAVDGDPLHWIVISGFDESEGIIYYWDPYNDTEETYTNSEFDSRWHWEKDWLDEQFLMAGGFKRKMMMWINHPAIDLTEDEPPRPDPQPSNQINNTNMVEVVIDPSTLSTMGLIPMMDFRNTSDRLSSPIRQIESVRQAYTVTSSVNSRLQSRPRPRTIYSSTPTYNVTPVMPSNGLYSALSPLYTHRNNAVYRPTPRVTTIIAPASIIPPAPVYRAPVVPSSSAPTSYISPTPTTTYSTQYIMTPQNAPATSYVAPASMQASTVVPY